MTREEMQEQTAQQFLDLEVKRALVIIGTGGGKELSNSELVLTPEGWVQNGSLKRGIYVIGSEGKPVKICQVYPQGVKDIYEMMFQDGTSVKCGLNHLWEVTEKNKRHPFRIFSTKELLNRKLYSDRLDKRYNTIQRQFYYRIKLNKPVQFNTSDILPIDPYTLGALLGDGSFRNSMTTISLNSKFDISKLSLPEGVKLSLFREEKSHNEYSVIDSKATWKVKNRLTVILIKLGLWNHLSVDKFIPSMYLKASIKERKALLQGLLDTDGHVLKDKKGIIEYSTSSFKLKNDIIELIRSLGIYVHFTDRIPYYRDKDSNKVNCNLNYRIYINLKKQFKSILSIKNTGIAEEATCITVEAKDALYIANGYNLTHNTRIPMLIIDELKPKKVLFLSQNTLGRDITIPAEMRKWGLSDYISKTQFVTYQLAYKWTKKTHPLDDTFVIADEADFAMTEKYGNFFKEYTDVPIFAMTGFSTEDKVRKFEKYFPLIIDIPTEELQKEGIVNQDKFIFVQFLLSKIKNRQVKYKDKSNTKTFMQSENGQYQYFRKQERKYYAKLVQAEKNNDQKEIAACNYMLGPEGHIARNRAEFLYTLDSAAALAKQLKDNILKEDPNNKVITFSVRTSQADKISVNAYHGKKTLKQNNNLYSKFQAGEIREISTCNKVDRNVNLIKTNNAIIEGFKSDITILKQRKGRMLRLAIGDVSDIYILIPYYVAEEEYKDDNGNIQTRNVVKPTKTLKWLGNIMNPWFDKETMAFETRNLTGHKIGSSKK